MYVENDPAEMKMETCWLSFECSSRMATDKSALCLSIGCSIADAGRSYSCPVKREEKEEILISKVRNEDKNHDQ